MSASFGHIAIPVAARSRAAGESLKESLTQLEKSCF
jgi:hypothetical protein